MKCLFAIKSLNVVGGGAEKVLVEVANGLCRRGHDIGILTFDFEGQSFYELDVSVARHDMAFNSPGHPLTLHSFLKAVPKIRRTVRHENPDVLVPFMHSTFVPLAAAIAGMRFPTIYSEHVDFGHYVDRKKQLKLLRLAKRSAIVTTVPSQGAKATFPPKDKEGMVVLANPVRNTQVATTNNGGTLRSKVVLSVGRLMEEKDFPALIDAFAMVSQEFPDWTLKIVGEGVQRSELEARVSNLGLDGRIQLPGAIQDVMNEYRKADFIAVSSRYESFGMAAAEALMCAKPVLSFAECAGVAEMIQDGTNGILVAGGKTREGRREAMANGLRHLMARPDLCYKMGKSGPKSVSHYDIERVLDEWEALLTSAIA